MDESWTVTVNCSGDLLWHNTSLVAAEVDARAAGKTGMDFVPQLAALIPYVMLRPLPASPNTDGATAVSPGRVLRQFCVRAAAR